ncbi:MAG: M16 family metallopeptidase [Usitatibacter sp.]
MHLTRALARFLVAAVVAAPAAAFCQARDDTAPPNPAKKPPEAAAGPATPRPATPPRPAPESVPAAPPRAAVAAKAPAIPRIPGVTRVTSVEGITEYRLQNGLKVLLFPDPSKPTVTVNITYLVGSRMENYGETGMAHLLEHLMFKGSRKHRAIDQEFNERGVRYNGTTTLDRTNYFEIFEAGDANLKWALELEADRMAGSFIAKKDLDSEMTVVRNEYESGENSPFSVLFKRLQSVAYDWHSYGRATIGNRSDIENVKIGNLQAFYRMYYQPDNAVLLVAGRFDEAKTLALVAKSFGPIPKPRRVLPVFWTVEPMQDGDRLFTVRRQGDVQVIAIGYHVPSNLHDDSDALGFSSVILGQAPTGRLHKEIVEKGLATQVFGYPMMGVDPGLQVFGAVVGKGQSLEPVKEALTRIVESFGDAPPTAEEMERTRRSFHNESEKTLASAENFGVGLSEYIALGDWRLFFAARDQLDKITAEQVAAASKKYFRRDNRTIGIFLPEDNPQRAEIPPAPSVSEVMKDFTAKEDTTVSEAFDPSQDNINARTKIVQLGGLKVALLSKKNRGETVNVALRLHLGNAKDLFGQQTNASMAGAMLMRGTTKYTRSQLSDEVERLKISGGVSGGGASFQTTRPNLSEALRLVAHVLKEPSYPQGEFDQLVSQSVTAIEASMAQPDARASEEMNRIFNTYPKGDFRYTPTMAESLADIKAAKLEDVRAFHDRFYGASPAEIALVGDFDEAAVVPLLKELFGDWKAQVPYVRVPVEYEDIAAVERTIDTPEKANAVFLARENVPMTDTDPDYPALYVADYILGGGATFDSRLGARIRQKEGISYGVGSELSVPSIDNSGAWSAYAISAPANMKRVETAFKEELARALKDGFTDAEVATAKSGIVQARTQTRAQDGALASGWAANLYLGRTFQWSKEFDQKIRALTAADVSNALRKYVDPSKVTVVKAGDFAKK